jgi:hypothetical protein
MSLGMQIFVADSITQIAEGFSDAQGAGIDGMSHLADALAGYYIGAVKKG